MSDTILSPGEAEVNKQEKNHTFMKLPLERGKQTNMKKT